MVLIQHRPKRTASGGRYVAYRKKRKFELGRAPTHTKLGEQKLDQIRTKGGGRKVRVVATTKVNLHDKSGKSSLATIKTVAENPANWHFVRRNIITKGTVVDTDKGKARVTSRPGQDGTVNAVLLQ